jgi:transcriptional regulator with XRE-family HTH domain
MGRSPETGAAMVAGADRRLAETAIPNRPVSGMTELHGATSNTGMLRLPLLTVGIRIRACMPRKHVSQVNVDCADSMLFHEGQKRSAGAFPVFSNPLLSCEMKKTMSGMYSTSQRSLGKNLRVTRKKMGLTISEVSKLTGLACSTISKVENDQMSPTYDKLTQLATGLQIDIASLFQAKGVSNTTVTARHSVDRPKDRILVKAGKYSYWYLNTAVSQKTMTPMLGRTKYKTLAEFGDYVRHPGEEFVFVVEGKIAVHTEHYEPVVLSKGDSLYIDSSMGHAYLAVDDYPCLFLSICTGGIVDKRFEPSKNALSKTQSGKVAKAPKPSARG